MHHSALTRVTADLCDQQGIAFIPMAAELLGGWHKVALEEAEAEEAGICASRTHWPGERKDHQPPSHQGVSAPSKRALVPPSQQDPWPVGHSSRDLYSSLYQYIHTDKILQISRFYKKPVFYLQKMMNFMKMRTFYKKNYLFL